jgi:hypothetical protein
MDTVKHEVPKLNIKLPMTQFCFIMASVPYWDPFVKFLEIPFAHVNKLCNGKRYKMSLWVPGRHNIGHPVTCIDVGARWGEVVSFRPHPFIAGKGPIFFMSPGGPHTWFGLFHVGTNLLLLQNTELRFLGHLACSPAHIIPLLFMFPAMISMFLPARTLAA